jgi:uncharacterized membrane protein
MTWFGFAAVFVAFFLTHSIPLRPAVKSRAMALIGAGGFAALYSLVSLAMLGLLIWSAGEAPFVEIWPQMPWHRHAAHLGMLAACLILALTIARPNPFSFGGMRSETYNTAHPGITRWTRHPVLLALALWSAVHLLPNGDVAHVLLFGALCTFSITGGALIDRRKRRLLGEARWRELDRQRRAASWLKRPESWRGFILRLAVGVAAFVALLLVHPYVIGVPAR